MHQPLSNFPLASIVFTYKCWTQTQVHSLFTFTRQFLESLFSVFPASLPGLLPPFLLAPHALPQCFSLWTLSFISTHIIPIPTLSSAAAADTTTARALLWILEAWLFFWISIPCWTQAYRIRVRCGDVCATRGFIICIACAAYKH